MKKKNNLVTAICILICCYELHAQNDVMMQAFYWNVPVNEAGKNGFWYDSLNAKIPAMKTAGIRALWMPPPSKGNWGISDMGYGIFDHYDLGAYNQKGSTETRFGSKSELLNLISTAHSTAGGAPYMDMYADVILNHTYGNNTDSEESGDNPAVKTYVFNKAISGGTQRVPFPTNEIRWIIPNASAGDYYIQISGFFLNYGGAVGERGYDVKFKFTDNAPPSQPSQLWEYEPNNGNGQNNVADDQKTYSAHMESNTDIDEYKITLSSAHTIEITLTARREGTDAGGNWQWQWAAQSNAYYPSAVWYNGSNLAGTSLKAYTATNIDFVNHTGTGEANYTWGYTNFHPVDAADFLGDGGSTEGGFEDQLVPNTKWFGNDLNTFDTVVQNRLKAWGVWLSNTIGYDGFRLDFVRGFQEGMVSSWVNNLPLKSGSQRFIVGEYFTGYKYRLKNWVNDLAGLGTDADVFDFPLKNTLTSMTNGNGASFNMANLNNAGMVRDNTGNSLSGTSVVTFLENHDTGKEHDKWVSKDWKMGYAYILFHEGRPCLFYPQYYGVTQVDNNDTSLKVTAPGSLNNDINKLISLRSKYLGGSLIVLTQQGNPVSEPNPNGVTTFAGDTWNVYAARRQGNGTKSGAILVINNNDNLTRGIWVDNDGSPNGTATSGYADWKNQVLVNLLDTSQKTMVAADGRVHVYAPARGYAIWALQSEYTALRVAHPVVPADTVSATALVNSISVYPNPSTGETTFAYNVANRDHVQLEVYDANGRLVSTLVNGVLNKGRYNKAFTLNNSGVYIYKYVSGEHVDTGKIVIRK
ncbi:MAG: T9SS type A sorting domain-containing protein [Bacteroidota bacterium]|nr:T9SS type A sorting domain-containing protein [Bacteroidota bacterium]